MFSYRQVLLSLCHRNAWYNVKITFITYRFMATTVMQARRQEEQSLVDHTATIGSEYVSFHSGSITKKNINKKVFLKKHGLERYSKKLVVSLVQTKVALTKDEEKMKKDLVEALEAMDYGVLEVYLGNDKQKKENMFSLTLDGKGDSGVLVGSDVFLFFEKKVNSLESGITLISSFGGIPVLHRTLCHESKNIELYSPLKESGFAFVAGDYEKYQLFAEVVKISDVFTFSYDWNVLRRLAMLSN